MKVLLFVPFLLITLFSSAQSRIIGKPIQFYSFEVAQYPFPNEMNWQDAGKACRSLGKGWRLPTKYELNKLFENMDRIGIENREFAYWSSAEYNRTYSWRQDFIYGRQFKALKISKCNVRAVRSL
jgi:hypothetical protein